MAELVNAVDLKSGLVSSRASPLSHSLVEPNFPSKQNTHFSLFYCIVLARRIILFLFYIFMVGWLVGWNYGLGCPHLKTVQWTVFSSIYDTTAKFNFLFFKVGETSSYM